MKKVRKNMFFHTYQMRYIKSEAASLGISFDDMLRKIIDEKINSRTTEREEKALDLGGRSSPERSDC